MAVPRAFPLTPQVPIKLLNPPPFSEAPPCGSLIASGGPGLTMAISPFPDVSLCANRQLLQNCIYGAAELIQHAQAQYTQLLNIH